MNKPEYTSELRTFPMTHRIIAMHVDDENGPPSAEVIAMAADADIASRIVNALNAYDHNTGEAFVYEKIPNSEVQV